MIKSEVKETARALRDLAQLTANNSQDWDNFETAAQQALQHLWETSFNEGQAQ